MPRKVLSVSEALSHPLRRKIVSYLLDNPGLSIRQLSRILNVSVGSLTGHIIILERVGLVREKRNGRKLQLYVNENYFIGNISKFIDTSIEVDFNELE